MAALFPRWMNSFPTLAALAAVGGLTTAVCGFWYYATPKFWRVGYMPKQPGGGFNHAIHAGQLGMDCRYCHTKIEKSAEANIPNVATCYGCHAEGRLLKSAAGDELHVQRTNFIRDAFAKDATIEWNRVHKVPDFVRNFPHNVHLNAGVSCFSCHGQITAMPEVTQVEPQSMSWCLDCHRRVTDAPQTVLVPKDKVTDLVWVQTEWFAKPDANAEKAKQLLQGLKDTPPQNCGACHY